MSKTQKRFVKIFPSVLVLAFTCICSGQSGRVISEQANLRGTPSESGRIIEAIPRNTSIDVIKQNSTWFLVQTSELVGWLHGNTIELDNAVTVTKTPRIRALRSTPAVNRSSPGGYLYRWGPRGGCFYINSSGNKIYVDHSYCR